MLYTNYWEKTSDNLPNSIMCHENVYVFWQLSSFKCVFIFVISGQLMLIHYSFRRFDFVFAGDP